MTSAPRSPHRHESVRLYGTALPLPRPSRRQRLLWWVVLRIAKYNWGQALIRRLRR